MDDGHKLDLQTSVCTPLYSPSCSFNVCVDEVEAESMDSRETSCVTMQTQYYFGNTTERYSLVQDCDNCSRLDMRVYFLTSKVIVSKLRGIIRCLW